MAPSVTPLTLTPECRLPLLPLPFEAHADRPPPEVRRFLRRAERRIDRFARSHCLPAFVGSDFGRVYEVLRHLEGSGLLAGRWFCEWGSGFGVVCCLASLLGFDAWGIEAEQELVEAARRLADDFGIAAEFACGSFVPEGAEGLLERGGEFAWLSSVGRNGYEVLGVGLAEFDLVFAYPWPDEEELVEGLFERYARAGAVLLTYHVEGELRLRRKAGSELRKAGRRGLAE